MRCYTLLIGESASPKLKITLDEKHPIAPRITFNIQQVSKNLFIPSIITVYNLPTVYFSACQQLVGEKIKLQCGLKESPITKMCNIKATELKTIFDGTINNILPDYDGTKVNISMYCGVSNVENTKTQSSDKKGYEVKKVTIEKGASMAEGYKKFFELLLGDKYTITVLDDAANNVKYQNGETQTQSLEYEDLSTAVSAIGQIGLNCLIKDNTITIYSETDLKTNSTLTYETKKANLTSQPTFTKTNSIAVSLIMDASIKPLMKFKMPDSWAISTASFNSDANIISSISTQFGAHSITSGTFQIVSVWHRGDSRGTDASSWVTEIEATTTKDVLLGESLSD